ncbi:subclass B1 metallo-beta-lactamase [Pseudoalteromonas sp. S16_S37]|uniref:subclass B1 metallo-beta-lactamase n=1 Tax=Pseudoalteromonas sp. S16_S37 TaxID=2720228 RepID=UPI0016809A23|nr:subclass B1 metallo-beta-lactamase [Pseudoalteromonas sp. S16_S37]MBD1582994.1 subclass B1 metallo-beta-lactamase [Pseudoalteromonas sp. S16_S37]
MHIILLFTLLFSALAIAKDSAPEISIFKLSENVYQHVSYQEIMPWGMVAANGLVIVDKSDAYIIDTPWTEEDTKQLVEWVKTHHLTLKGAIISHFHEDASSGIEYLNKIGITTYANKATNQLLRKHKRALASHSIDTPSDKIANDRIEVFHPGAGHSKDNVVVWFAEQQILFAGCFAKNLSSTNLGNLTDADVKQWPKSIANLKARYPNIKLVVPGHGKAGDTSLLDHTAQLALSAKH